MTAPLDSRQLRAFASLARTSSFTRTARELHLSQSAISHSIKAPEADVRCRLFDRVGKSVMLTQAGLAQETFMCAQQRIWVRPWTGRGSRKGATLPGPGKLPETRRAPRREM